MTVKKCDARDQSRVCIPNKPPRPEPELEQAHVPVKALGKMQVFGMLLGLSEKRDGFMARARLGSPSTQECPSRSRASA